MSIAIPLSASPHYQQYHQHQLRVERESKQYCTTRASTRRAYLFRGQRPRGRVSEVTDLVGADAVSHVPSALSQCRRRSSLNRSCFVCLRYIYSPVFIPPSNDDSSWNLVRHCVNTSGTCCSFGRHRAQFDRTDSRAYKCVYLAESNNPLTSVPHVPTVMQRRAVLYAYNCLTVTPASGVGVRRGVCEFGQRSIF